MIVLDTNVLSEPFKSKPSTKVLEWLDGQVAETLYMTTITRAELRFGVLRLPDGKRKKDLTGKIEEVLDLFNGRTLAFDVEASEQLAQILARTEKVGQKPPVPDAYIAAIAAAKRFAVATQNVNHFQSTGIPLINPWN
jgi:predicted nucleic acid-binding protein